MQPLPDRKALLGKFNSRLKEALPWQPAVVLMRKMQHRNQTRNTHCPAPTFCLLKRHGLRRLTIGGMKKERLRCCGRCGLSAIVDMNLSAVGMNQEGASTKTTGLRLDKAEHHLTCDGRVNGTSAFLKH
jgi:hypothetical protein